MFDAVMIKKLSRYSYLFIFEIKFRQKKLVFILAYSHIQINLTELDIYF